MKKLLIALIAGFMIATCFSPLQAKEKSIELVGSGQQVENTSKSYEITYKGQPARVFYGNNGIDIITAEQTIHFNTSFAVLKLLVIDDVNQDDTCDFVVTEKSADLADNLYIIDGETGEVLHSTCLTREIVEEQELVKANTFVLMMKPYNENVIVVYDYTIMSYNCATGEVNYQYVNQDNIWDIEIIDDTIVFVDQLGQIGYLDALTGQLQIVEKISNEYECRLKWDDTKTFHRNMNLWDVSYIDQTLYVTSEDGILYMVDLQGNVLEQYFLEAFRQEDFEATLSEEADWNGNEYVGVDTGLVSPKFKSFKIIDHNEKYLMISYNFIDEESLQKDGYLPYQGITLVDKQTKEVLHQKIPVENSKIIDACFATYQQQPAILIAKVENNETIRLEYHDYEGALYYQKSLDIATDSSNPFINVSCIGEDILVESYHVASAIINEQFEINYLFDAVSVELLYVGDTMTYLYSINGRKSRIVNMQLDCQTINWQYDLPYQTTNKAIDSVKVVKYDSDEVLDYICLIQNVDSKGNEVDTTILILSGKDGSVLAKNKVFEYKAYDNKGKAYNVYLHFDEFELLNDLNGDGKKDFVIQSKVIVGTGFSIKGYINNYIDAKGEMVAIGDVNNDKVTDYIMLTDTSATLYQSRRNRYDFDYVKSGKSITLKKNDASNQYYTVIGDLNNDGAMEIAFSATNSSGHQYYVVYDGKTMKRLFDLSPRGVGYYEELQIANIDVDQDGYNEILHYSDTVGYYALINGKTGEPYIYFNPWEKDDLTKEYVEAMEIWHPEEKVLLNVTKESEFRLITYRDINQDQAPEYALIKNYTDYDSWQYKKALFIYDGKDLSRVDIKDLDSTDYSSKLIKVDQSDDYFMISGEGNVSLFDALEDETIASYQIQCQKAIWVNDSTILAMDQDNKLYLLNTEKSFELLTSVDEETADYQQHFTWKNNEENSIMTIKDNNVVVYKGALQEVDLCFTQGHHHVIFELNDGQGKSSIKAIDFTVMDQPNTQVYLAGVAVVVAIASIMINLARKVYVSRKVKEGLK